MAYIYRKAVITVIITFLLESCYAQLSGTYTVNKGAPASSSNFVSFQSLFSQLSSAGVSGNVVVDVVAGSGPYTEQVTLNAIPNTSPLQTVTINGNGQVLQYTASTATDAHTLRFSGADYVTINHLGIKALDTKFAWGIHFTNASDFNTIDNCVVEVPNYNSISPTAGNGIVFSGNNSNPFTNGNAASDVTISNCVVKGGVAGGPMHGMVINPQTSALIDSRIRVVNNHIIDFRSVGLYITNCGSATVKNNRISRPTITNISASYGIRFLNSNAKDTVEGNYIFNCFGATSGSSASFWGIDISTATGGNNFVINNVIYENSGLGKQTGILLSCSQGVKVMHNTISMDYAGVSLDTLIGFNHTSFSCNSNSSEFRNNIISITRPGTNARYGVYQNGTAIAIDNNNIFVGGTNGHTGWAGANYTTLADWKSATGPGAPFDQNSEAVSPNYLNLAGGNLTPLNVQLDGIGYASGVAKDIAGNSRDVSSIDPGAFDFNIDLNVHSINLSGPSNCQGASEPVKVWVKNKSLINISGFKLAYRVNGGAETEQNYLGVLNAGDSVQVSFTTLLSYTIPGVYNVEARVKNKPYASSASYIVNVKPAPLGTQFALGPVFEGQFAPNNAIEPDIVASPDTISWRVKPPTGYDNKDYGTKWMISRIDVYTEGGNAVNGSDTSVFYATPSQDVWFMYRPSSFYTDSTVIFTVTTLSLLTNCAAPPVSRQVFIAPRPSAAFIASEECHKAITKFSNISSIKSGTMHYKWFFGNGDTSNQKNTAKLYAMPGTYQVKLVATSNYGYKDSVTMGVNVLQNPATDFVFANACEGKPIAFTNTSVVYNGSPVFLWEFGDGVGTSALPNPVYGYGTPGHYSATLTVTDAKGCKSSINKQVTFSKKPLAGFTLPILSCHNSTLTFTNNSTPAGLTGYTWQFGDGGIASTPHADHIYLQPGTYNVKLIARNDFNCADSAIKSFTVKETPAVDFAISGNCVKETVTFTNTTPEPPGNISYHWTIGSLINYKSKHIVHNFPSAGEYDIQLQVTADGCVAQKKIKAAFGEKPVVDFSLPATGCTGQPVQLKSSSVVSHGQLALNWNLGDGHSDTAEQFSKIYKVAGDYGVWLKATSVKGCADSLSRNITISATPISNFAIESGFTADGRIIFSPLAPGGNGAYLWLYGDGGQSNNKGQHDYLYMNNGKFKATLRVSENGCESVSSTELLINPLGIFDYAANDFSFEVYPNPSQGRFTLQLPDNLEPVQSVDVYNVTGALVYSQSSSYTKTIIIDLESQPSGVYFVKVVSHEKEARKKITLLK